MSKQLIAGALVTMAALTGTPALAQDEGARFTVGGGAGVSVPLHGDLDFQAAGWEVAGRGRPAAHLTIEAFASNWQHTTETLRTGLPLQGPAGVIGTVGELTQRTRHQTMAFGASLLPTFSAGRATVVLGGGANVMFFQRRFDQELDSCTTPTSACGSFSNSHSASSLGTHVVAGVDVRLAARLLAFGQYRLLVPINDPGSGHTAALAGVRLALR